MARTVTVDEVMAWRPCDSYPRERVEELWAGRRGLTALEILDLKVPGGDRLWAVLRNEFFTDAELRELACDYAESVIGYYEREFPGDDRPRNAIRVARRFARGDATHDELSAAQSAALGAALSAAGRAAWNEQMEKQIELARQVLRGKREG